MLLLLLISHFHIISAIVTLYQSPYYLGPSITLNQNDTSINEIQWHGSIQSIQISPNESFITYDQEHFQGNNATWYRSTEYPGNWKDRIHSFRVVSVISPPINPEKQNAIHVPWYFMETSDSHIMVRMSSEWRGYPECYAVNGVNCILGKEVDNLLPILEAYQKNTTLNKTSTTFNAPCGPKSYEHWGSSPEWCNKASILLKGVLRKERDENNLLCINALQGVVAHYNGLCIPRTNPVESQYNCRTFSSIEVCALVVQRFLFAANNSMNVFTPCQPKECVAYDMKNMNNSTKSGEKHLFPIMVSIAALLIIMAIAILCYLKRRAPERTTTGWDYRNTCHSFDDLEDHVHSPHINNAFVRAPQ